MFIFNKLYYDPYVDKTLFIKEFLESEEKLMLITYPRNWCKTSNIEMLKDFLQIEQELNSENSTEEEMDYATDYELFQREHLISGSSMARKLDIANELDIVDKYLGRYPVINLQLLTALYRNYLESVDSIRCKIRASLRPFEFIFNRLENNANFENNKIISKEVRIFRYLGWSKWNFNRNLLIRSLKYATKVIHEYFGKKVFVLIDDYDSSLTYKYESCGRSPKDLLLIYNFLKDLIRETFKDNDHIEKGLICGRLRFDDDFFEGLNIKCYCYPNDTKFYKYFCLTESEAEILRMNYNVRTTIEQWEEEYGGYRISPEREEKVFKLSPIVNSLKFRGYSMLCYYFESHKNGELLLSKFNLILERSNNEILIHNFKFNPWDLMNNYEVIATDEFASNDKINSFIALLFVDGYLTFSDRCESDWCKYVQIVNREMHSLIESMLRS